jgi:hypothetical protein
LRMYRCPFRHQQFSGIDSIHGLWQQVISAELVIQ